MGKAAFGSAKYLSNQMKSRGLQKLKFYCQICNKQCRDDNGFKCHIQSKSHLTNLDEKLSSGQSSGNSLIEEYSEKFLIDFLRLLRISHGEKFIGANKFYQEYIHNKDHIHMNSSKWKNLTSFIMYLKEHDYCTVKISDEDGEGNYNDNGNDADIDDDAAGLDDEKYMIAYIDKSPEAVARRLASKKEVAIKTDEDQILKTLQRQIDKGKSLKLKDDDSGEVEDGSEGEVSGKIGDHESIKIQMKPIMKCGMRIIPTDLENGVEGRQTDETNSMLAKNGIKFKGGMKLKSRFNKASATAPKSGNVFKQKKENATTD